MLALVDAAATSAWPGRTGKILLLVAGLMGLLDVVGPRRLARWALQAARRRYRTRRHRRFLHQARRLLPDVIRIADCTAARIWESLAREAIATSAGVRKVAATALLRPRGRAGHPGEAQRNIDLPEYIEEADFEAFVQRQWTAARDDPRITPYAVSPEALAVGMEDASYEFCIERLPAGEADALRWFHQEARKKERRVWRTTAAATAAVVPLGTLALLLLWATDRLSGSELLLTMGMLLAVLPMSAVLAIPRIRLNLMSIGAEFWFRTSRVSQRLIGSDRTGRPLRAGALVMFVFGSLLDLTTTWNQQ